MTWSAQIAASGDNDETSPWSDPVSVDCDPETAPGPTNIITEPSGSSSISLRWVPVTGFAVNRYAVTLWDRDTEGAFIEQHAAAGNTITIANLKRGHRYSVWV